MEKSREGILEFLRQIGAKLKGRFPRITKLRTVYFAGRGAGSGTSENRASKTKKKKKPTPVNQMDQQVKRGQAPDTVKSVHKKRPIPHDEQDHIHFKDGNALNVDGTWKHGCGRSLTNAEKKWLRKNHWHIP